MNRKDGFSININDFDTRIAFYNTHADLGGLVFNNISQALCKFTCLQTFMTGSDIRLDQKMHADEYEIETNNNGTKLKPRRANLTPNRDHARQN